MALASYKSLLRAQKRVFFNGMKMCSFKSILNYLDQFAQAKARQEIRSHFETNKNETDNEKIKGLLSYAAECEKYLVGAVVQANQIEGNSYSIV
jgi:hypothetical protein